MATVSHAKYTAPARTRISPERYFYTGMAVLMTLIVFIGFAPTYYLQPFRAVDGTTTGGLPFNSLLHLHGILFTGWMLLFVAQPALIGGRRVALHRRLGVVGGVLAALMTGVGVSMGIAAARAGSAPPGVEPLAFLIIPLGDIAIFATFVGAALWRRSDREAHKRLMLLATVSLLPAAVARLPGVLPLGPLAFYGLGYLLVVAGVVYDWRWRGRVHPVYVWGLGLLVALVPLRLVASGTGAWWAIAEFLTR